ncbi:MAG: hypothetical protein JW801_16515 [Bacteroidales bacterium]|nr:hypothetical protein [Bacteroidales bacterium]
MKLLRNVKEYANVSDYAISYLKMRKAIGFLGLALPLILIAGSFVPGGIKTIQPSISEYYDTYMRDIFVGILCAVALFLFSYRGFNVMDNAAANFAAFFALGVAFFPTSSEKEFVHYIHLISAALFFITLSLISIFLFTLTTKGGKAAGNKLIRNRIYRSCGYIMFGSILIMFVYVMFLEEHLVQLENYKPIFVLESIALFAFGTSWLIKGRTLWAD